MSLAQINSRINNAENVQEKANEALTRCSGKALQDALVDRKENSTSFWKLSKKCNIPRTSSKRHVRAAEKGVSLTGQGRKLVFSPGKM